MEKTHDGSGKFLKGHAALEGSGRPKGSQSKLTLEIKQLIGAAGAKMGDMIAQKEREALTQT